MAEEKYQKLASEYAKLKAQIPVLKKAYLDEQTVSKGLKDQLKEREQSVRKLEQELDSLTFRNQQLSKRVLLLQDELEESEASKKKNKNKHADFSHVPQPSSPGVYSEELQNKIMENERLHKQVDESNRTYQNRIQELEQKLYHYEKESSHHQEALVASVQKSKSQIDRLQEEKAMLEVRLQTIEADVKSYRTRAELAEEQLTSVQSHLQKQLDRANKIIEDKLPFIDTKNRDLNGLNLPTHDRKHQLRARELVGQSSNLLSEMIQALSNFYTYSEQRSKIYPADGVNDPLSPVNIQYCKHLHENVTYLRPVEQAMKNFLNTLNEDSLTTLETATDLQAFSSNFKRLVAYMNKLLPYQLSSIKEECAISSCTSTLETKNMELHDSLQRLNAVFNKLQSYIHLLSAQSLKTCCHPKSNYPHFFSLLSTSLKDLDEVVREVSKHYNSKVSLEHQMPTATQKLKTTDECIVSSLISLVTCTGKFSAFMSGNLDFFNQTPGYKTRGSSVDTDSSTDGPRSNPATVYFRQKAAQYVSSLSMSCPESVPHKLAIQQRKTLLSSAESKEGLSKQLMSSQQKVTKLEQEKEHWMLELQLLKIKYDNEMHKTKKLEKEISTLTTPEGIDSIQQNITAEPENIQPPTTTTNTNTTIQTSMLGQLEGTHGGDVNKDTREILIKDHFTSRINDLTLQLQVADSKAVSFHSEVRALHKQLQIAEKFKSAAEEEQKEMSQRLAQLKDEFQTTAKSYEGQLSMMSEHLAAMNEKIASQKDEIDELKSHQTPAKGHKKSRK